MKKYSLLLATVIVTSGLSAKQISSGNSPQLNSFIENKGQVHDQNLQPRSDVRFSGTDGKLAFHLKNDGISYQLSRVEKWKKEYDERTRQTKRVAEQTTICRIDVAWLNANADCHVRSHGKKYGYTNYYAPSCPDGALEVASYADVTYENIYNGIDLKWYFRNGYLEYDYIVAPGADYRQIQLRIAGASSVRIDRRGALVLNTPLGKLTQQAPVAIQQGRLLKSAWVITAEGSVGFSIVGYDPTLPLVIDPVVRSWGTYYGGSGDDYGSIITTDANGDVYMTGFTGSSFVLATSGAHQVFYAGGTADAFLAKFNSSGVRLWSTYYGASGLDFGNGCATDGSGNVYLSGSSTSAPNNTAITTSSSHQPGNGGGYDAFLVKFNSSGVRQWGTFYGGSGGDLGQGCATDKAGNVYLAGYTTSSVNIATPGSHQPAIAGTNQDGFLVKFNSSGVRQWGTYYGGTPEEYCWALCCDGSNVFIAGYTQGTSTAIATSGAHQTVSGGPYEAYLVKFDGSGVRQWGTYYGGSGDEIAFGCAADTLGNVYLSGDTDSGTGISTFGAHQTTKSSSRDGFLAKFDAAGVRLWGTYYGGTGDEYTPRCYADATGDVFLTGGTGSQGGSAIATSGVHQPAYGGGSADGFLAKFDASGTRLWATYYGGSGSDYGSAVCTDTSGRIYLAGYTSSSSGQAIASSGGHQTINGGGAFDTFLAQLIDCTLPSPVNITPVGNRSICSGKSASLSASGNGTITWYASLSSTVVLSTGSVYTTPTLSAGNYTYFVEAQNCAPGTQRTPVTVTVNALPLITINSSKSIHCLGSTTTLTASGATTYTWSHGGGTSAVFTVSPPFNTGYTVSGTNGTTGCSNTAVKTLSVVAAPQLTVSSSFTLICAGEIVTLSVTGASTYSWATIATGTQITLTPSASADYTVTGADVNGCTDTEVFNQQVDPCTGLREGIGGGLFVEVYPNPFNEKISILIKGGPQKEIEIVNMLGEVVYKGRTGAELKLGHLSVGLYLVKVEGNVVSKVVKE